MYRIDFVISNDRHHVETFEPVLEALQSEPDVKCRVLSLCEFRGLRSPARLAALPGVTMIRLTPPGVRRFFYGDSPPVQARPAKGSARRWVAWFLLLAPTLTWLWFRRRPSLVVLPNDSAYPYDHLMKRLQHMNIRTLLVQEGIRFPLPTSRNEDRWGMGGATAIAAWGPSTADLLIDRGIDPARIHPIGSPRLDTIVRSNWKRNSAPPLPSAKKYLLLVTNPVDQQGFCTTAEKLDLVRRFVIGSTSLLKSADTLLIIKTHAGERFEDYRSLVSSLPENQRLHLVNDIPLYPLLESVDAVVILASTVGLEALLFGLPLAVIGIPGSGFVHDFVSAGAALGIHTDEPFAKQLATLLLAAGGQNDSRAAYLDRHLATRGQATQRLHQLIRELIECPDE